MGTLSFPQPCCILHICHRHHRQCRCQNCELVSNDKYHVCPVVRSCSSNVSQMVKKFSQRPILISHCRKPNTSPVWIRATDNNARLRLPWSWLIYFILWLHFIEQHCPNVWKLYLFWTFIYAVKTYMYQKNYICINERLESSLNALMLVRNCGEKFDSILQKSSPLTFQTICN